MRGHEFLQLIASGPLASRMHPLLAGFLKDYLACEKVVRFGDQYVINTHFPPYPSRAFDNLIEHFTQVGDAQTRRLVSVTLAVTNRCHFHCWHCYNAGRSQQDAPLPSLRRVIGQLQQRHAAKVTLTGGEPLLREDLEAVVACFDDRTSLCLNTTGWGLTAGRAKALKDAGLFAAGVSLDSSDAGEHDRLRGRKGAFDAAIKGLQAAGAAGLYPYVIAVATREFLVPEHFHRFLRLAQQMGALEVHLLEPCATGRLAGQSDVLLTGAERQRILDYQRQAAQDDHLPIVSTFLYLESADAFGCGAGLTHLYIDGSGEVCPCNLVPLSFGNVTQEPLEAILDRMGRHFHRPRTECVGRTLGPHVHADPLPAAPGQSMEVCERYLPREHPVPRFFQVQAEIRGRMDGPDVQSVYDRIGGFYDEFWLSQAAGPIRELVERLSFKGEERVFEAGCGTGFATVLIARRLRDGSQVTAVDLSTGMLEQARRRAASAGLEGIRFVAGDALENLTASRGPFDLVFSTWVLGYIPLEPFFKAAHQALSKGGRLAFVVHRQDSPREILELFKELAIENPQVLQRQVAFDFPQDGDDAARRLTAAGLTVERAWEGSVVFRYDSPAQVFEHLLKSGAGTAYYDAIDPDRRQGLQQEFVRRLALRNRQGPGYQVVHDYLACVARKD